MSRIAYLASEYPAPSHTFIRREIAALRKARVDIKVFTIRPASGQPTSEMERDAREETQSVLGRTPLAYLAALLWIFLASPVRVAATFRLALGHRAPGLRALVWSVLHFVEATVLARLLRRTNAAHLHVHFANSGATVGMLAAHMLRMPWSMTLHGISETDYPAGLLLADKVARAHFVACASWFMRAQAMRVADPRHWSKLHVVRCGIDPAALPSASVNDDGRVDFICVGRLSGEKGQRGLLEAFAVVRDRVPSARLSLVGGGPLHTELMALADALSVTESVRFHGPLNEAETLAMIARSDVLVLPSFMEGLPLVIIEAMALGKPVVASGVAGIPELVRDRVNGLLVPPSDWSALAGAMAMLATDSEMRNLLGIAAGAAVMDEFVIDRAVLPLISLFAAEGR